MGELCFMKKISIAVLDAATLGNDIDLSCFDTLGETKVYSLSPPEALEERIHLCDVCVTNKVKLDSEILSKARNLRLICVAATGYDNIDTEYCRAHGIAVCNVAGYSTNSVSQLTLAMVLSASVNLSAFRGAVADGSYSRGGVQNILTPVYRELAGKTWGIIGYGGIGRKVGEVARALGCRVVIHKRTPVADAECLPLEELLSVSDIITVHVPLNGSTRGLIGKKELELMKDGVFLVNVARGAVLDEFETAKAVENGKIGFFGCDVYSEEPMPEEHPYYNIRNYANVCLTPHMAWGAFEARNRCVEEMCENIKAFLANKTRNRIV